MREATSPQTRREHQIVFWLCLIAAVRVFVFSSAFPFFNSVDETRHFDVVVRYASGSIPRQISTNCPEAFSYIILFGSVEYLWPPDFQPPAWTLPIEKATPMLLARQEGWNKGGNAEVSQPPLYYALAGSWWHCAKWLGLHDGSLLYSVRYLNMIFLGALVWLGYAITRLIFPGDAFIRLGTAALLAFLPQTAFYSIQNDVLSPVCSGGALLCVLRFLRVETPGIRAGMATGLLLAAVFLTKLSNLPVLAVLAAALAVKARALIKSGRFRAALPALAALTLCAALPAAVWIAWCKLNFGDFLGAESKIQCLRWTHKPVAEWWNHPVFTPHGLWTFLSGLLATFWQGEFLWHRLPLAFPAANLTFALASVFLLSVALGSLLLTRDDGATRKQLLWICFGCVAASILFLGFLSIIYDFHDCFYPSREHPYFTSGRLMLGAAIPFVLLFVYGLDHLLRGFSDAAKFTVLGAFLVFLLATEIAVDWQIFPNPYNWYHM